MSGARGLAGDWSDNGRYRSDTRKWRANLDGVDVFDILLNSRPRDFGEMSRSRGDSNKFVK